MNESILAIDLGLTGGLVFKQGNDLNLYSPPIENIFVGRRKDKKSGEYKDRYRNYYREQDLIDLIKTYNPSIVIMEKVNGRPTDSAVASFSLGESFGIYKTIARMLGAKVIVVPPQNWKKALKFKPKSTKEDSRQMALKLYPQFSEEMKWKKDHNLSESLLILHWYLNHYKETG